MNKFSVESRYFRFNPEGVARMHRENWQARLDVLPALQNAITPFISNLLDEQTPYPILEIACGTNFFRKMLAPTWLKDKLIGFDIVRKSLKISQENDLKKSILFQGDVHEMGLAPKHFEAIIGLSSFDSFSYLQYTLTQAANLLKNGKPLILIQDALTTLYKEYAEPLTIQTVNRYLKALRTAIDNIPSLKITENNEGYLEGIAIETHQSLYERTGKERFITNPPLAIASNCGDKTIINRSPDPRENQEMLEEFKTNFIAQDTSTLLLADNQVLEWALVHFLVAEKV